jgi:hypothetical protein
VRQVNCCPKYREQKNKDSLTESGRINAQKAAPSMFERLKGQVLEDLKRYNADFSAHITDKDCIALGEDTHTGFRVTVGAKSVEVDKPSSGTVIEISYPRKSLDFKLQPGSDHLEVEDDNGKLKYRHGKKLLDEHEASLVILDRILCGGDSH